MLACVHIPAFPLQVVLLEHDDWKNDPLVVVAEHKPIAPILWVNKHAQAYRIHRGMKFGAAQALSAKLRAAVVPQEKSSKILKQIFRELLHYSPEVEVPDHWPGLFWVDPNGLEGIFGSVHAWATGLHEHLEHLGYVSSVVVGFERYAIFALAKSTTGSHVLPSREEEAQWAKRVPLARLGLSPKLLEQMAVLGVETLEHFLRLPGDELRIRYGEEAESLHRLASGKTWTPFRPKQWVEKVTEMVVFEEPERNHERILFALKSKVQNIIVALTQRSEAVVSLCLIFRLEKKDTQVEQVETAGPTLDLLQVLELLRLKLTAMVLRSAVEQIEISVQSVAVHLEQMNLLQEKRRDLKAGSRALARIKAAFGKQSVVQAVLQDAVLPEARYRWKPLSSLRYPQPVEDVPQYLVRRVLPSPIKLASIPKYEPERWLEAYGGIKQIQGPYRIHGGWWLKAVARDYYYAETRTGELLWLYYDKLRQRWMLHGMVD